MTRKKAGAKKPSVVGANVRRIREHLGLSQEGLGERCGLHRVYIAELETGARDNPSLQAILALAEGLGVRVADLTEPELSTTEVEPLIREFLDSHWGKAEPPSPEELAWLRKQSPLVWIGVKPTPKSLHLMLESYRAAQKAPRR